LVIETTSDPTTTSISLPTQGRIEVKLFVIGAIDRYQPISWGGIRSKMIRVDRRFVFSHRRTTNQVKRLSPLSASNHLQPSSASAIRNRFANDSFIFDRQGHKTVEDWNSGISGQGMKRSNPGFVRPGRIYQHSLQRDVRG
jgi:hypothetical protein